MFYHRICWLFRVLLCKSLCPCIVRLFSSFWLLNHFVFHYCCWLFWQATNSGNQKIIVWEFRVDEMIIQNINCHQTWTPSFKLENLKEYRFQILEENIKLVKQMYGQMSQNCPSSHSFSLLDLFLRPIGFKEIFVHSSHSCGDWWSLAIYLCSKNVRALESLNDLQGRE